MSCHTLKSAWLINWLLDQSNARRFKSSHAYMFIFVFNWYHLLHAFEYVLDSNRAR